jgi:hypothetical protein
MPSAFGSLLKVALSPGGRKTVGQAVRIARSEEGRKLIAQTRRMAASPEGRKLIAQAKLATRAAGQAAKASEKRAPIETLRDRLRKL